MNIRLGEAQRAAAMLEAIYHPPIFSDLEVFYDKPSLLSVAAVVRAIKPQIILTHTIDDYMEDHQNVCRLITTAAFSRSMVNFQTSPVVSLYQAPVRIYHAPPHGLKDGLNRLFEPDFLVNVEGTIDQKARMLACHESQYHWLGGTQGMNRLDDSMREMCSTMASWGYGGTYAEAWRRHSSLGFCAEDFRPLEDVLFDVTQPISTKNDYASSN